MADNIVGSLFGISPEQLMQQRQLRDVEQQFLAGRSAAVPGSMMSPSLAPFYQQATQQGQLIGRGVGALLGGEDPELQKVTQIKQLSSQFDLTTPQGMRQFAGALQSLAPNEAMMAAKRADEMMATQEQTALRSAQTAQAEAGKVIQVDLGDRIQLVNALTREVIREIPKGLTPAQAAKARAGDGTGSGDGISGNLGKLNTAEKAVDTKFGKEYADYFAGGGINSLEKNVEELDRAIKIIEQSKEGDTSGKVIGLADKTGQLTFVSPLAADVKDIIGGVAQSNLRQVLGGQFAAKEGEALLQRAYDTGQTKDNNLKRLRALYSQASKTVEDKKAAAQYYEQFGTLKGFKGTGASDKKDNTPPKDKNQEALDWIKANPTDPRVPAIKKKLGIQ